MAVIDCFEPHHEHHRQQRRRYGAGISYIDSDKCCKMPALLGSASVGLSEHPAVAAGSWAFLARPVRRCVSLIRAEPTVVGLSGIVLYLILLY